MATPIFSRKDSLFLLNVQRATVTLSDSCQLMLTLSADRPIPPAWTSTLAVDLLHDQGSVVVACRVVSARHQGLRYSLTLEPAMAGTDAAVIFGARVGTDYLHVGHVTLRTPSGPFRTLLNQTSRAGLQARTYEPDERLLDIRDLEPQA